MFNILFSCLVDLTLNRSFTCFFWLFNLEMFSNDVKMKLVPLCMMLSNRKLKGLAFFIYLSIYLSWRQKYYISLLWITVHVSRFITKWFYLTMSKGWQTTCYTLHMAENGSKETLPFFSQSTKTINMSITYHNFMVTTFFCYQSDQWFHGK